MDVRTYLRAVRKSWWILVLTVVLGGAAGFGYSKHSTPVYAGSVTFFVGTSASASTNAQSTDQFAQSRAVSYAKLLSSDITAQNIIRASGLKLNDRQVAREISGVADLNTVIITATIQDTSKARAFTIARALAQTFPSVATSVEPKANSAAQVHLQVVDNPKVGPVPVLPRTKLNTFLGLAGGLLLGLLIAVLRFLRDTTIRTRDELEAVGQVPVVGDIAYDSDARNAPLVLERQAQSIRAESFRQLRTNLQFVDAAGALHVVVITSSAESEGKSTTATNLALMFAETGRSVLLVGADLRRPRVAEYLGLESAIGLTNVLVGQVELDDALQAWGVDGMSVLASGSVPPNPSELLGSAAMGELMTELRRRFDIVIIDTPPLLPVTDAAVLAVHADGVVVVCRHGKTRRVQLATAMRALESVSARVVGTVLNMRPTRGLDAEHYGQYRYYSDNRRGWLATRLPTLRRKRAEQAAPTILYPVPSMSERVRVPIAPEPVASTYEDRVGLPTADGQLSSSALAAFRRRRARSSRGGRRARMVEAIESRPGDVETAERDGTRLDASPANGAGATPATNGHVSERGGAHAWPVTGYHSEALPDDYVDDQPAEDELADEEVEDPQFEGDLDNLFTPDDLEQYSAAPAEPAWRVVNR